MINNFDFLLPTKIRYGLGMIKVLGEELRLLKAKKIMIITDKGLVKAGMVNRVTDLIKAEGLSSIIYDEIEANPKDYNVELAAQTARKQSIDTIVAFGGGSPIDAAKAVTVLAKQGGGRQRLSGKREDKKRLHPSHNDTNNSWNRQ